MTNLLLLRLTVFVNYLIAKIIPQTGKGRCSVQYILMIMYKKLQMLRVTVLQGETVRESVKTWLGSPRLGEGESFKVIKAWIHENYKYGRRPEDSDIGLIELENPVTFTQMIRCNKLTCAVYSM